MADRRLRRLDRDRDRELRLRPALVGSPRWRHVGVIAAHRDADMALAGQDVVGRIETDPAQARQVGFDPGVGGVVLRAVLALLVMEEIAGDVARGHAPAARDGDHDMREILTDAAALAERVIDRRMHFGNAGLIGEGIEDGAVEPAQRRKRVALGLLQIAFAHERHKRRRHMCELRGLKQVELLGGEIVAIVAVPFEGIGLLRRFGERGHLHHGLRLDAQLRMLPKHVEMIDRIAGVIGVGVELGARIGGDLEGAQRLRPFRARLHAQLHHALAHGRGIAEASDVADGVVHYKTASAS